MKLHGFTPLWYILAALLALLSQRDANPPVVPFHNEMDRPGGRIEQRPLTPPGRYETIAHVSK